MKRVFYYSGYRMTVFHWSSGKLAGSYYFEPTADGYSEFQQYLNKTPKVPARILVDVIEEDFRTEIIPHVYGGDRKAIIDRLLDRYYRNSGDYRWAQINGRESSGRRDDKVLLVALTNPEMLRNWLVLLSQYDVPVRGIWSLPLLSEQLLKRIKAKNGHVLLISQQVPSNVRQSYFYNGKIVSSRSATLALDEQLTYGKFIRDEIDQTIRFLSNKRYLGFDEKVDVHIIPPYEYFESAEQECANSVNREITVHKLQELAKEIGIQEKVGSFGNSIFARLCNDDHYTRGQYGGKSDFSIYNRYIIGNVLRWASALVIVIGLGIATQLYFDMRAMQKAERDVRAQTAIINSRYHDAYNKDEPKLKLAEIMKASVELAEKINSVKRVSPQTFMVRFSDILSSHSFNLLNISSIEWQASVDMPMDQGVVLSAPLSVEMPVHDANITGNVSITADNIRQVVDQLNLLVERLKKDKQIISVEITKMPVDVRSTGNVSMQVGTGNQISTQGGDFSLHLVMKGDNA